MLFSPPGTIADEVIRRLVAAEPTGRVVLVATADREIVESSCGAPPDLSHLRFYWIVCESEDRLRP